MSVVATQSDRYPAQLTRVTLAWVAVGLVLFPILALLGFVMRTLQAGYFAATPPEWFYAVITLHGLGMVGVWFVAGLAALSFVLSPYARPSIAVSWIALGFTAVGVVLLVLCLPASASAQELGPAALSQPIVLVLLLALAALAPFLFMSLTAFVKISTVLQITRGALGAQNIPSNTVILALAAALTVVTMAPVGSKIMERTGPLFEADGPQATSDFVADLIQATREPLRGFLKSNASERERSRFRQDQNHIANEQDLAVRELGATAFFPLHVAGLQLDALQ